MPGKRGADVVGASALACSGDFLLRLAGRQREDLVAEVRRTALAASGFCGRVVVGSCRRAGAATFFSVVGRLAEVVFLTCEPLL